MFFLVHWKKIKPEHVEDKSKVVFVYNLVYPATYTTHTHTHTHTQQTEALREDRKRREALRDEERKAEEEEERIQREKEVRDGGWQLKMKLAKGSSDS